MNTFTPHGYQKRAVRHILDTPRCALFMEMGLGKTVVTLSAIAILMRNGDVRRSLVVAPLRVAEGTWAQEAEKWAHTSSLRVAVATGTPAQRVKALHEDADIYIINRENLPWLVSLAFDREEIEWSFDMVVLDELSSFKSAQSKRFKAMRRALPYSRRIVGLTGTPAPNSLIDLWPQIYLLDEGERLGKTLTWFRSEWFRPGRSNGYVIFDYIPKPNAQKEITEAISDICLSMRSADYLELPPLIVKDLHVKLPSSVMKEYRAFERAQVAELDGHEVTAVNAAALAGKLLQWSGGAVYDSEGVTVEVHRAKQEALGEIMEAAGGRPVMVFYAYKHELARIRTAFAEYKPEMLDTPEDIAKWNRGETRMILAHPASCGHGLNLQAGGHIIVWYGLTWSLELYQQAVARLYRQGQNKPVRVFRLIADGTLDSGVIRALSRKDGGQAALMEAVKAIVSNYTNR